MKRQKVIFKGDGDVTVYQNEHLDEQFPEDEDPFIDFSVVVDQLIELTYDEHAAALEVGTVLNKHFISGHIYLS